MRIGLIALLATVGWLVVPAAPAYATVTSEIDGTFLTVTGDGADDVIDITCEGGDVKINGVDPGTGSFACADLAWFVVLAGAGGDEVTLEHVDPTLFTSLEYPAVDGGPGDDILTGSPGGEALYGKAGFDTLIGGADRDTLIPGADGGDLRGGGGRDVAFVEGSGVWRLTDAQIERVSPVPLVSPLSSIEYVYVKGGSGPDRLDASGFGGRSEFDGRDGADRFRGGTNDDRATGGYGLDRFRGGGGNDVLDGGPGRDTLEGQAGDDYLLGGPDQDTCRGGPGHDDMKGCP